MFEISLFKIRLRFTFAFFAVIGFSAAAAGNCQWELISALLCSLAHELGHIIAMTALDRPPESITFYAGGIMLPERGLRCSKCRAAVILLAGVLVNLSLALLGWLWGLGSVFTGVNLLLGAFNLLPFRYFDGGRLYEELFCAEPPLALQITLLSPFLLLAVLSLCRGEMPVSLAATLLIIIVDCVVNNGG